MKIDLLSYYRKYRKWPYWNTFLLLVSLLLIYIFIDYPYVQSFFVKIGSLGYLGSFIAGIMFVSIFTVAPASIILFDISNVLNPVIVAIIAGLGTIIGDYIIFKYLKDNVFEEMAPIFDKYGGSLIKKLFLTPFFIWLLPILGAILIASPLPDEAGITMLGLSKVKLWQFILITFALNTLGIFVLVSVATVY